MKLIDIYKKTQQLQKEQDKVPWDVRCVFGPSFNPSVSGDQINVGGDESDFVEVEQAQKAVEWLVAQIGGTVKWKK